MQALPADGTAYGGVDAITASPRLDYDVEFVATGTHYVWVRAMGTGYDADSLHVGLDGAIPLSAEAVARFAPLNGWVWSKWRLDKALRTLDINPLGRHTLSVWMREAGTIFDKIVITTDSNYVPTNTGPIESTVGVGGPGGNVLPNLPSGMATYLQLDENNVGTYSDVAGGVSAGCTSCPQPIAGLIDSAQLFDGVSSEMNLAISYGWNHSSNFTIEFWMRSDSACSGQEVIVGRHDPATQLNWWVGCDAGAAAFYLQDANGNGNAAGLHASSNIADGAWHHVVAIHDGSFNENRLYVDGTLEAIEAATNTGAFESAGIELNVGWLDDGDVSVDKHFAGAIDEIALYDRVISDRLITRHFEDVNRGLQRGFWGCGSPVKTMPLGDSNTNAANGRKSYRPALFFDLVNTGYAVDFVGSRMDPSGTHDRDHEGWSGYTPSDIAIALDGWLMQNPPETVLLHIGTNGLDSLGAAAQVNDVEAILNIIDGFDPNITVVLGRIINRATYHQLTTDFNIALDAMAQTRIANGDRIFIVDHEPALDYPVDMVDELHAAETGYEKMADVWQEGLSQYMPVCNVAAPVITSIPLQSALVNTLYSYTVQTSGFPEPGFSLMTAPAGMQIHPDTGDIIWTPDTAGVFDVIVKVQNSEGTTTQSFTINVN
jgi:hypothetical protein